MTPSRHEVGDPLKKLMRKSSVPEDARPQNPQEIPCVDDDDVSREANEKRASGSEREAISREAIGKRAWGSRF